MSAATKWHVLGTGLGIGLFLGMAGAASAQNIVVDAAPSHAVNAFSPFRALGGAIDRLRGGNTREENEKHTERLLTDPVLKELLGAGWQTVTYRQNTELMIEAWHWNPRGTWSNAAKQEGYFTGSAEPTSEKILHSWAYPLPHRGATLGDGNGWSRLTDGDLKSYWKSNPYLTKAYTGEDDSLHPQWVMIDLGAKVDVNAIRIAWAGPYARRYYVQFWTGEQEPFYDGINKGAWQTFPMGTIADGKGGTPTLKLMNWKIPVRYLRIWMTESSNTCDTHGAQDRRNCVGYAINELSIGTVSADGQFTDVVKHLPSRQQTITWPSSVDPWHAASDLDYGRGDQIGFDFFFNCGVTRGLPAMIPIAMLYAIPEDAANEIAYLYKRKYPISWIEMGEEADGQRVLPEDYATLYIQFAKAIHKLVPNAPLGGPAYEGTPGDVDSWADANGRVSFLGRFVDYLKARGHLQDFTFFSFEHYPCMGNRRCADWGSLYWEPAYVNHVIQSWKDNGLPPNVPFFMTEGNDLGEGGAGTVKSALWQADYIGSILTAGAGGTYFFHYIASAGRGGGGGGFLPIDENNRVRNYPPQYLAAQVITKEWVQPVDAVHKLFKVASDVKDADGNTLVTAYTVERPDGRWSVMLVNKDQEHDHSVRVSFADPVTRHDRFFAGTVDRVVFGPAEYQWHPDPVPAGAAPPAGRGGRGGGGRGGSGHADPDGPPSRSSLTAGGPDTLYQLPKASIIVLRGKLTN
jgi:F5/8 type C domain